MKSKNFLFVTGCARSGTSALAELIGNHPKVVMGMERYGRFYDAPDLQIGPEHFERERFFDVRPEDTFYTDFNAFHAWDKNIREKFDDAQFVGDKRPNIHRHYDDLFDRFPGATVYYIFRNIIDVAGSWEARKAAGAEWSPQLDFAAAVATWNDSLRTTIDALQGERKIVLVRYDSYFADRGSLTDLFSPLGLDTAAQPEAYYAIQQEIGSRIAKRRQGVDRLTSEQRDYVEKHADLDAYQRLLKLCKC